jgi:hypothetical protein
VEISGDPAEDDGKWMECPYKAGLPYDFDHVRLFIWNVKKPRITRSGSTFDEGRFV